MKYIAVQLTNNGMGDEKILKACMNNELTKVIKAKIVDQTNSPNWKSIEQLAREITKKEP